jgi:hypothetical protein
MNFINLKKMDRFEVRDWLFTSIPELTKYQKETISDFENGPLVYNGLHIYKVREKKETNFFLRLTIIPALLLYVIFVALIPVNFLFTGSWGYNTKTMGWFIKWCSKIGLSV